MPQELVLVYAVEDGSPKRMHSVDAVEAVRLGDYSYQAPQGKEPSPEQLRTASFAMGGAQATVHPELQTPEERAETRRQANELAAQQASTPVVLAPGSGATVHVEEHAAPEARATAARATARREAEEKK